MQAPRRILAIDDQRLNLVILSELLRNEYDVRCAASGDEALAMLARAPLGPDLVLLDLMMPGLDGYETCRRLRRDPRCEHTPILLVSAKPDTIDRVRGYEAGANDYVVKPFDGPTLLAKIKVYLRLRSAEEAERAKEDLLTVIAHEIRTPLTGIVPAGEALTGDNEIGDDERRLWGEVLWACGRRLTGLAEGALLLSRLRAGCSPALTDAVSVAELLEEVRTKVTRWQPANCQVEVTIHPDLPLANTDRNLLATALVVLLERALHPGEHSIGITAAQNSRGGLRILLTCPDLQLDPEIAARLSELGLWSSASHRIAGADLGLVIAREILSALGVRLDVATGEQGGTAISLTLPTSQTTKPIPQTANRALA